MVEKGNKIWSTRKGNLSLDYTLVKKRKTVSIARLPKYSLLRGLRLDKINSSVKCSQTIGFRKKMANSFYSQFPDYRNPVEGFHWSKSDPSRQFP